MSDLHPHLLNATCSDDTEQVYVINFGFSFNDLSDKEKEMAFHSQWYLAEKYCKKWQKELANNQWAKSEDEMPDELNPYVIGFSKDEYDVEIVGYEEDFKEWRDKSGKPHNITHWMPLPTVPDFDEDWEEEE